MNEMNANDWMNRLINLCKHFCMHSFDESNGIYDRPAVNSIEIKFELRYSSNESIADQRTFHERPNHLHFRAVEYCALIKPNSRV